MDAKPINMSDVFAGEKQYIIPVFQRWYEWEKKEWQTLWQDVIAVTDEPESPQTHFIGPFVIISRAVPYDVTRYLVIDGQQRLITITLILAALRDRANEIGLKKLADAIERNHLLFPDTEGNEQAKIIPRIRDREILLQLIRGKNGPLDSDSLLVKAYEFFYDEVRKISERQQVLWDANPSKNLQNLYHSVTKRLLLVSITLGDNDNPSNIYESLNFKGRPLSDADLIRNQ